MHLHRYTLDKIINNNNNQTEKSMAPKPQIIQARWRIKTE